MISIIKLTKEVYRAFIMSNGKFKIDRYSNIGRLDLPVRTMRFFTNYIDFVVNSGVISEVTKVYFNSIEFEPMEAIRVHNMDNEGFNKIDPKKASNHFYYDGKRLLEYFPRDMITNLKRNKGDIETYESMLKYAIEHRMGKSKLGKMSVLHLPNTVEKERPSDYELDSFFMLFAPYTKEMVEMVQQQIPNNVVGYLNYLSSKTKLDDDERAVIDRLNNLNYYEVE